MSLIRYSWPWRSPYFLVGDRLRRPPRGLAERPHDGAPRKANLEVVVSVAFGAVQQPIRGLRKCGGVGALSEQGRFGRGTAPWLVCDTTKRQAGLLDRVTVKFEGCRHRDQRERIGQAIADLQVGIIRAKTLCRKLDGRDDLIGLQICVALRRVAGQPMEIRKRDR